MAGSEVVLKLYDISRGAAAPFARPMGLNIEAIWHSGILVHGLEVFFGGGIVRARPDEVEREYQMTPLKIIKLGNTSKTLAELHKWCDDNSRRFSMENYRLIENNCNHFADALAKFLIPGDKGIPDEVVNQHKMIEQHPLGGLVLNLIKSFDNTTPRFMWSANPDAFEKTLRDMWDDQSNSHANVIKAITHLKTICSGILQHATDAKYREVKESAVSDVIAVKHGNEALAALGLKKAGSAYKMDPPNAQMLQSLNKHSQLMESLLDKDKAPARAGAEAPAENRLPGLIPTFSTEAMASNIMDLIGGGGGAQGADPFASQIRSIMAMGFTDLDKIKA